MKSRFTKMWFMSAAALSIALLTPKAMMAQIGPNSLEWGVGGSTVTNGSSSGSSVSYAKGATASFGFSLQGVSGNGGSTSYNCTFINTVTGAVYYMPFSGTTTSNLQKNGSMALQPGVYNSYCTATYSGTYANGTVSTPFIQVTQN